jgi:Platelet-activating factor acetylhydrolase, isoform II
LAEDLASHGYVVVGFDAPYRTSVVVFPDGRVVTRPAKLDPENLSGDAEERLVEKLLSAWVSDVGFVVDRLTRLNASDSGQWSGRLDILKIGIVGHSLGGATAAQFCHDDTRAKVGVDLDGRLWGSVVRDGISQPFMFLLEDVHGAGALDSNGRQIIGDIESFYDRLPAKTRIGFSVRGANHFSFTDSLLEKSPTLVGVMRMTGVIGLEPRRGLEITAESVCRFLDVHLKGVPVESLQELSKKYPELQPLHADR